VGHAQLDRDVRVGSVGIESVVLSRQDESPQSLFQKFMTIGARARFAIVLLGADDYGASRRQYDASGVGDRALQFRARQNVVLEDLQIVNLFRAQAKSNRSDLEFENYSIKEPFNSMDAEYVRSGIRAQIRYSTLRMCL
jgi:hypothetical protein